MNSGSSQIPYGEKGVGMKPIVQKYGIAPSFARKRPYGQARKNGATPTNYPLRLPSKVWLRSTQPTRPSAAVPSNVKGRSTFTSSHKVQVQGIPALSHSLEARGGPLKPIVPLNTPLRFQKVEGSAKGAVGPSVKAIYRLERKLSPRRQDFAMARRTLIGGLTLSQRRSGFVANARRSSIYKFTKAKSPRKTFIVHKYSMRRIRHSQTTPNKVPGPRRIPNLSQQSLEKLELSSLSLSQNSAVRLATRALQRSRQRLSKQKRNTFCMFYNRFGTCKRQGEGLCPFVHDPRQLQICSAFLSNGKCGTEGCKLSHDLKVGRVPPCRFFNEGSCSRESCPYLHVRTVSKKKLRQNKRESSQSQRLSVSVQHKKPKRTAPIVEPEKEDKSRYFEICPDSQPTVAIIPRRYPKGVGPPTKAQCSDQSKSSQRSSESDISARTESRACNLSNNGDLRRQRLMGQVAKLRKPNKVPSFLAFNPT